VSGVSGRRGFRSGKKIAWFGRTRRHRSSLQRGWSRQNRPRFTAFVETRAGEQSQHPPASSKRYVDL